ncbi:MAG: transglutaminase-like domain-containing protein [Promethearchaeota archaeon]
MHKHKRHVRKNRTLLLGIVLSSALAAVSGQILGASPASCTEPNASSFRIEENATYTIQVDFKFKNNEMSTMNLEIWMARFSDWGSRLNDTPPYQTSTMMSLTAAPYDDHVYTDGDIYDNQIDFYNVTLGSFEEFTYRASYNVTLNEIQWQGIDPKQVGEYNTSDFEYQLFTRDVAKIECTDPVITNLAAQIVEEGDPVPTKAQKIQKWVVDNLEYEMQDVEHGAVWAAQNLKGDCSEFSDLTIALLRSQHIPARKAIGWAFFDMGTDPPTPQFDIEEGQAWNYQFYQKTYPPASSSNNLTGHAWVEYYLPNYGWIACDPTWSQTYDYYNRIDYIHLTTAHGQDFGEGINPSPLTPQNPEISEFTITPYMLATGSKYYTYDFTMTIKVTGTNLQDKSTIPTSLIAFIVVMVVISVVSVAVLANARRR